MTPTVTPSAAAFKRYTTILGILNVLLAIAAVALLIGGVIFWGAGYAFNDSGHVQAVATAVHGMLLDALFCVAMLIWQHRVRKEVSAMLPKARVSVVSIGVAYLVVAGLELFEWWPLALIPAGLGVWFLVVFLGAEARAAFDVASDTAE
jgi:hypothetical protein